MREKIFGGIRKKRGLRWIVGMILFFCICGICVDSFVWKPRRTLSNRGQDFYRNAAPEEMRRLSHDAIRFSLPHHDAFLNLIHYGDEESVPLLISTLRWAPDDPWVCTWDHCFEALKSITNSDPGDTFDAWKRWYAKNGSKRRTEWISQGFTEKGCKVDAIGSRDMVLSLFAYLGRSEWEHRVNGTAEHRNARRLIDSYRRSDVVAACDTVIATGTPAEKLGMAWYFSETNAAENDCIIYGNVFIDPSNMAQSIARCGERSVLYTVQYE